MRLSSVDIVTDDESSMISFGVLDRTVGSKYLLRAMVGIDADEIVAKFYARGLSTSQKFYEYILPQREIVMRVAMRQDYSVNETVSEIRDHIYRLVSSNRSGLLNLRFNDGANTVCQIRGAIVKVEAPYFTQTPEVQITFSCPDPMFRSVNPYNILPADLEGDSPLRIQDSASNAPHGFSMKVKFTATTSIFRISDDLTTPDWHFEVEPIADFAVDDEFWFSSEYGQQLAWHNKASGTDVHIMDKVSVDSVWPQIFPGLNEIYLYPIANVDILEFKYYAAYWGL